MHSFIEEATFLRRSSASTQPLSFSNLEKFNASPSTEGSQSLFDLLPAVKQLRNEQEAVRPQRLNQDGPKLWLSPHTADVFLVVPPSTVRSHTPAATSRSNTPEQQAASSPMAISNLVRRDSTPFALSSPQSTTSSRKRSREESQDTEATSSPRPLASHDGATEHTDANERAKRRKSLAYTSYPQRTLSASSVAPSDRPLPSGSSSTGSSAHSSRRGDVRVYRVHKSIIAQCGLLRDLLEPQLSPRLVAQESQASTSAGPRSSRAAEDLTSQALKLSWPLSLVATHLKTTLPLAHRKPYLPSKRFSGLALPTLLPSSGGGGGAAPLPGYSRPVSPTTPCVAAPSAPAGPSSRWAASQGRDAAALTTVHMPVPDGETMPLLLHYLYHHALAHLAKSLNRQATSCATAAAAAEGRCADADADWEAGREEHYRRLIGGLIANFDYLGVEEREPREWLAGEWKRLSAGTGSTTSARSGGVAAGQERRTSLRPLI